MDLSAYLDLFVAEAREHIAVASSLASRVDGRETGGADLRELFRHVHSVKGMAASMGFAAMSSLAHDAESLMDLLRHGRIAPKAGTRRTLSDALACLERMVDCAEARRPVDDGERAALQQNLRGLLHGAGTGVRDPAADPGGSARPPGTQEPTAPAGCVKLALIVRRDRAFPAVRAAVVLGRLGKLGRLTRIDPPMAALRTGRFDGRLQTTLVSEVPLRALAAKIAALEEVDSFTLVPTDAPPERETPQGSKATLRVRADRLDALIEDVLDLMTSIGRIDSGLAADRHGSPLAREAETARRLARSAYDGLVDMRLLPFEIATHRLRRAVDELSRKLAKPVSFDVEGDEVRIDRSMLERLIDPLLHMVRNAIDHGFESPEARRAANKPAAGRLRIAVGRHASGLSILVEDDGRGLDPRRLKQVAIERGLLTPLEAVRLANEDALMLITLPGFSTSDTTNEVSGRGVGMDVVKHAVEAMGGRLRIEARPGRGARFELALPATVALVQAYVVRAGGMSFAVPIAALLRMAPVDDHGTVWRDGRRYSCTGSEEIPVWGLCEVLRLAPARRGGGMALIAESARGATIGIEVDEVVARREIVVRPLPVPLSGLQGYSGAAVLEDGSIVLVLDPANLPLA
jgi:two-component system, chemotaxis family, sensor kinase CheA